MFPETKFGLLQVSYHRPIPDGQGGGRESAPKLRDLSEGRCAIFDSTAEVRGYLGETAEFRGDHNEGKMQPGSPLSPSPSIHGEEHLTFVWPHRFPALPASESAASLHDSCNARKGHRGLGWAALTAIYNKSGRRQFR